MTPREYATAIFEAIPGIDGDYEDEAICSVNDFVVNGPEEICQRQRVLIFGSALHARLAGVDNPNEFHPMSQGGAYLAEFLSTFAYAACHELIKRGYTKNGEGSSDEFPEPDMCFSFIPGVDGEQNENET